MYYEDLIPSLEAIIPDVTDDVLLYGLRSAGLKFFKESKVWCEPLPDIRLSSGRNEIELEPLEDAAIHSIPLVTVDGLPLDSVGAQRIEEEQRRNGVPAFFHKQGSLLRIGPTVNSDCKLRVYVVSTPTLVSDQVVNDDYIDKYSNAIVWAAAHIIMAMPRKPWSDKQSSNYYLGMYSGELTEARRDALGYLNNESNMMDYRDGRTRVSDY